MSKIIETGSDSRTKLLSGVNQLANAVVTTLGPNGRNVVIAQQGGNLPTSTKDGVTVAKTVTLKDPVENLGAQMVKQASIKFIAPSIFVLMHSKGLYSAVGTILVAAA